MPVFTLTTQDPTDPWLADPPETLMPLADWLEQYRGQELVWIPEYDSGIGIWIRHGTAEYLYEPFGPPDHMARTCEVLAERLAEGKLGLLLAGVQDECCFYAFTPDGDVVRARALRWRPPRGIRLYHSGESYWGPPEELAALHASAEEHFDDVLELLPTVPREELIANLRAEAVIAHQVAEIEKRVTTEINRVLLKMSGGPAH